MNKLEGFFELRSSEIPTVPWKQFKKGTTLDNNVLWTIRCAVLKGDDLNLPRKIGATAADAEIFANGLLRTLGEDNLVIYYPYFIAKKSGILEVSENKVVIEAVKDDLWNLVTHNKLDVSITFINDSTSTIGDKEFLTREEIGTLISFSNKIKRKYREIFLENKSLFLEWSFANMSDANKLPTGDTSLVFYEIRSVK